MPAVTVAQILQHLSPYDLNRVTFQMPDGLPIVAVSLDTDETGGAILTLSDESATEFPLTRQRSRTTLNP